MAITRLGLRTAERSAGSNPTGTRMYLVGSDTKITTDVDTILDASYGGNEIPAINDRWDVSSAVNLRVDSKRAQPADVEGESQEGYWWMVTVNYTVPEILSNQDDDDPRERDWLWAKGGEQGERVIVNSLFDTSGYTYPEAGVDTMVNLAAGDAITNTAFEPPEGGVLGPESLGVIQLQKFINDFSDVGCASWAELDDFVDTLNDATVTLLGRTYDKWELLMDEVSYEPYSENGYDCIKLNLRIIADTFKTHVFTFVSAGYSQIVNDELVKIKVEGTDEDVASPKLLDDNGAVIPTPVSAPFISTPYLVSAGRHELADWSTLTLPAAIP